MLIADDFPELGPNLVATLTSLWGVKIRNCDLSRWLIAYITQALLWYIAKSYKEIASISSGIVKIYTKIKGRYNLTWIWTISLMVGRLAGAWSACIDWTLWSGSVVDEADHQCGQNGPDRESPEQSATKNSLYT